MDASVVYGQPPFPDLSHAGGGLGLKRHAKNDSALSAQRIASAHSAQMDATMAAARADFDAKMAELMADLEGARSEKEKTDTELAYLKASTRKERIQWNKDRTLLSRKVAEAEHRAREAADGVASAEEFLALQKANATHEETIRGLHRALEQKGAQQDQLEFEAACASTAEADVDLLMVRVASLESSLAGERDARKAAEEGMEARAAEARAIERRLISALEAASRAESEAATCMEETVKTAAEIREARGLQRHAELWLEESLAEVDAVHALLAYERSSTAGANNMVEMPTNFNTSTQTPHPFEHSMEPPRPPSPAYDSIGPQCDGAYMEDPAAAMLIQAAVGPTAQTPIPESPGTILGLAGRAGCPPSKIKDNGGDGNGRGDNTAMMLVQPADTTLATQLGEQSPGSQASSSSNLRTPELDATRPLFSTVRLRSRVRERGREGMGWMAEEEEPRFRDEFGGRGSRDGGGASARDGTFSPPTPTVLFGELAKDGGSTTWEKDVVAQQQDSLVQRHANSNGKDCASGSGGSGGLTSGPLAARRGNLMVNSSSVQQQWGTEHGSGHGGSREVYRGLEKNTSAFTLSLLQAETSRREKAEAKIAELEAAVALATAVPATTTNGNAAGKSTAPLPRPGDSASDSCSARADNVGTYPCVRQRVCGKSAGQTSAESTAAPSANVASVDPATYAQFVKMDQQRQREQILALVGQASAKLKDVAGKRSEGADSRKRSSFEAITAAAATGGVRSAEADESFLDPSTEVAALIRQFEGKLNLSVEENAQLRDFCAHLEGLLAAHEDSQKASEGFVSVAGVGGVSKTASNACQNRVNPFNAHRELLLADRRIMGAPVSGRL